MQGGLQAGAEPRPLHEKFCLSTQSMLAIWAHPLSRVNAVLISVAMIFTGEFPGEVTRENCAWQN